MLVHFILSSGHDAHINIDKSIPFALNSGKEGLILNHPTHNNAGWRLSEDYSYQEVLDALNDALNGISNDID